MLTAEGCAGRRKRLWEALPGSCDFLIVGEPQHLIYFANYVQSPFVFRSAEAGALLLLEHDRATLVSDNVTQSFWSPAAVDEVVAPVWYNGKTSTRPRQRFRADAALDRAAKIPGRRVGIELSSVPAAVVEGLRAARPGLEIIDLDPVIRPLRRAKDPDELALIRRSVLAGEAGHRAAIEKIEPGMTELDAFLIVQNAAMTALGDQLTVYGDFASGNRTATEKGGPPTARKIERGDLFLLDYSVVVGGYRGDFTNTFAIGSEPTARQRELFEACAGALAAGEARLKPGAAGRDVDAAVRAHFASLGLDGYFTSHSGHGLGLGHPEPPYFVPESTDTLQAGDVVALEPGVYIDGVGGMRYERNYLITAHGFENLTQHAIDIAPR